MRQKVRRRRSKNTEEGDKCLLWGRRRHGLTDNFTLAVYMQFLVAADTLASPVRSKDSRGVLRGLRLASTYNPAVCNGGPDKAAPAVRYRVLRRVR